MYFFKIILLNIVRQKKCSFPVLATMIIVCLAITVVLGIYTNSLSEIEDISKKYVTTVTPAYYPLRSQTRKSQQFDEKVLTKEDSESWPYSPEVKLTSYRRPCAFSLYMWQFLYNSDDFSNDIVITDADLMQMVYSYSVLNSEYCDRINLVEGTYIGNEINADNTIPILISDYIASKTGLKVNETITISYNSHMKIPSNKFVINGIFSSNIDGTVMDRNFIYIPHFVADSFHESNEIITTSSHLDYLLNVKFVLKNPDDAEAFISRAYPYFQDKGFVLQANDYEYKKEVYPLKMMLQMNGIIGIGLIFICLSLLFIILLQSIRIRRVEFTVFRLLSLPTKKLLGIYILEKCLLFIPSSFIGVLVGSILLNMLLTIHSFSFLLYAIIVIFSLCLLLILFCLGIYMNMLRKSLMGEMSNGK